MEEWLQQLALHQYYSHLWHQGYKTVNSLKELTWEDLEEIGITKLGQMHYHSEAIKQVCSCWFGLNNIVLCKMFSRSFFANKKLIMMIRTLKFGDVTYNVMN